MVGPGGCPNLLAMSAPKPRSGDVTDGYQRAPARAMLRAVGMHDADFDKPQVGVVMTPKADGDFKGYHRLFFDARTGALRVDERRDRPGLDLTGLLLTLHANMFAGLFGEIFLGLMAVVFLASLVSGAVLYAPSCASSTSAQCAAAAGGARPGSTCTT